MTFPVPRATPAVVLAVRERSGARCWPDRSDGSCRCVILFPRTTRITARSSEITYPRMRQGFTADAPSGLPLILIGLAAEAPIHLAKIAEQVPVVEIGQRTSSAGTDSVRTDGTDGMRQALDHLVHQGHRDILHIDGGSLPGSAERRFSYRETMRAYGFGDHIEVLPSDFAEESGARAANCYAGNDSPRP